MNDQHQPLTMDEYQQRAQQAIAQFEASDGLQLKSRAHDAGPGYLELWGSTESGDGVRAFVYRASHADLDAHGDGWFLRRALRSLNDMFVEGQLPSAPGDAPHQVLRPPAEGELPEAEPS